MSGLARQSNWEVSAEVRAVSKQRLPLRLPRPDETGSHRLPLESRSSRPVRPSLPMRRKEPRAIEPLSDVELESMAQRALLQSGIKGFTKLHVEVRDRQATVVGSLPTEFERQLAVQLVRRVNGVESVADEISVWERRSEKAENSHTLKYRSPGWLYLVSISVLAAILIVAVWIIQWA